MESKDQLTPLIRQGIKESYSKSSLVRVCYDALESAESENQKLREENERLKEENKATYKLLTKPREQLKKLEDLWRKENPRDKFTIPDQSAFYKWISGKVFSQKETIKELEVKVREYEKLLKWKDNVLTKNPFKPQ